jgi:hypothetical protein
MRTIIEIFLSSLRDLKRYYRDYLKLLIIPSLLLVFLSLITEYDLFQTDNISIGLIKATEEQEPIFLTLGVSPTDVIVFLLSLYFQFGFAFLVHKITLGKASGLRIVDGVFWRKKHVLFVRKLFIFSALFYLVGLALYPLLSTASVLMSMYLQSYPGVILIMVFPLLILPFLYFMSRVSLALPAAANNEDLSLSGAFRLSKNYGWVILLTTFVFTLVVENISFWTLHNTYLDIVMYHLSLFLGIVLLTNCYKFIKKIKL